MRELGPTEVWTSAGYVYYFPFVTDNMNIPIPFKMGAAMLPLTWPDGSVWKCDTVYVYDELSNNGNLWTLPRKAIRSLCPQKDPAVSRHQDASKKLLMFPEGHGANVFCVGGTWSTTIERRYIAFVVRQTPNHETRYLLAHVYK